jgi:hypothetical protein
VGDVAEGLVPDEIALAIIVAIGVVLLLWLFILPALIFVLDLLVLLIIASAGIAVRVLFRRPWDVVAQTDGPPAERAELPVAGWKESGAYVDEVAYRIESTGSPYLR